MNTYKTELTGADGSEIITVTSKFPLSPMQIKQKLINWIDLGWELTNYWECTNHLIGYSVNAINKQTEQEINYFSSSCKQDYLSTGLQQELELEQCQKDLSTERPFNAENWIISVRPQIKIIS